MINLPYGQSDFKALIEEGYFYQDRTKYVEILEKWHSKFPVFLRPRRFGKSLFIMMLQHYYGLEYKDEFPTLFKNLYIGQHPTAEANTYMVLSFDFSGIDTTTHDSTYKGFLKNVISGAREFLSAYGHLFTPEQQDIITTSNNPESVIINIFDFIKQNQITDKIYLLIDEYDHFANELLSFDFKRFKSNITENGFVRKFYENLKKATRNGIIGRIFITGVSPITMDSMTSGFNISDNITLNPIFHNMMGFRHAEVEALLIGTGIPLEKIPMMMSDLAEWYDGYQFAEDEKPLFNPDMILYFLKEYSIKQEYPKEMLDSNIVTECLKVLNVFSSTGEEKLLFELMNEGYIDFSLTRIYNFHYNFTEDDFLSLLFYWGMLTFKESLSSNWRFEIPNNAMRKLYLENVSECV